jgi:hypothetical protein
LKFRRNKYHVAPPNERRWNGRTYASKAEMVHAQKLDLLLRAGELIEVVAQPRLWLGVPENVYVPDFLVIPKEGPPYYVDVKGVETAEFKKVRRLWVQYGRLPLHVVKKGKTEGVIEPPKR